jgi:putative SOS response-associated peptidase YedK
MCNVIGIKLTNKDYVSLADITKPIGIIGDLPKLQSGFSYRDWAIITASADKTDLQISLAHWEFIPNFIKNEQALVQARKQGIPWLNATAEKLLQSKMFNEAAIERRCLIPISYFFEWQHIGKSKLPFCISLLNEELFYVAGIFQPWVNKDTGEQIQTFAMVTTAANELMAKIHNTKKRMPTILPHQQATAWLTDSLSAKEIADLAGFQLPGNAMKAHTIAKNFLQSNDPTLAVQHTTGTQASLF